MLGRPVGNGRRDLGETKESRVGGPCAQQVFQMQPSWRKGPCFGGKRKQEDSWTTIGGKKGSEEDSWTTRGGKKGSETGIWKGKGTGKSRRKFTDVGTPTDMGV